MTSSSVTFLPHVSQYLLEYNSIVLGREPIHQWCRRLQNLVYYFTRNRLTKSLADIQRAVIYIRSMCLVHLLNKPAVLLYAL